MTLQDPTLALKKFTAPPQSAQSNDAKPQPIFPGIGKPSVDFETVRDGRRSTLNYYDVALDNVFSISNGNPLILPISGNSFYVDQDTSVSGSAYVHFQDTNLGNASAPVFVNAGFIAKIPFTQLLIENKTAQAGKKIRIFYGVDVDFTAGINATLILSSLPPVTLAAPAVISYGASAVSYGATTLLTPVQLVAPASNVNGIIIWSATIAEYLSTNAASSIVAKSSAPANPSDGDVILNASNVAPASQNGSGGTLNTPVKIPAGKGIYYISGASASTGLRSILYTVL